MDEQVANPAIELQGVRKRLGQFTLEATDVVVPRGYVTGLVGPNGAGKTTLIKAILGLVGLDEGTITLLDGFAAGDPTGNGRVGVVLDAGTFASEWRTGHVGRRIGGLYPRWDETLFHELLHRFHVPIDSKAGQLSRGQSVKLAVAVALAHRPDLLVFDEPTSGLDPVARRDLAGIVREFMLDNNHTVLFSTHITAELDDLADHIIVLNQGTVAYTGLLDDLHEEFAVARGPAPFPEAARPSTIGLRFDTTGAWEGLIRTADTAWFGTNVAIESATTDDIVVHFAAHRPQEVRA